MAPSKLALKANLLLESILGGMYSILRLRFVFYERNCEKEEKLMRHDLDRDAEGVETVPDDEVCDALYTRSRYRGGTSGQCEILIYFASKRQRRSSRSRLR